ncbi:xanthine dehydrogenase small subunit [Desulfonema ishimotonii]|uniref:Xanthine dehydrogenase small subunit n=1 Tax=Desulfonema ishimotonii TaxID=45657 RepID=A0A401FXS0_9BACT|nr:xanthine dehydrogenase small subunit [Desulfonema ishimotonii]GBC61778.1 xanthine dehydrogenase small subunit [Desulfonema ishimotonii]
METQSNISFILNDKTVHIDFVKTGIRPTITVLEYLRGIARRKGTKEGCAEGDCGACTVVVAELENQKLSYNAVNSCLIFLPQLHGRQLITVEDLEKEGQPHPVQQAMIENYGAQCGFCTPGMVMSLFALYKSNAAADREAVIEALVGNLCRCTGYRPIVDAGLKACAAPLPDCFSKNETGIADRLRKIQLSTGDIALFSGGQKYFMPKRFSSALRIKKEYPKAILINGATDIALLQTKQHKILREIIDLSQIGELKKIEMKDDCLTIGAGATVEDIKEHPNDRFQALGNTATRFGAKQIRLRATVGGNIANASPVGDLIPVLMAYNAKIRYSSLDKETMTPIEDFITGYRKTILNAQEIIRAVEIPVPKENTIVASYKISRREHLDISSVNAAFRIRLNKKNEVEDIGLFYGGMASAIKRATKAERFLTGKKWTPENVRTASKIAAECFSPVSDARSSAEARQLMAANLLIKFRTETK